MSVSTPCLQSEEAYVKTRLIDNIHYIVSCLPLASNVLGVNILADVGFIQWMA